MVLGFLLLVALVEGWRLRAVESGVAGGCNRWHWLDLLYHTLSNQNIKILGTALTKFSDI